MSDHKNTHEIVPISLRSPEYKKISFIGADALVHCAALVHQMNGAPAEEYFRVNHDLTLEVARKAKAEGVRQFIFISTAHVYGDSGGFDHSLSLRSDSSCHPLDPYGQSKLAAENDLLKMADSSFIVSVIRPPMVYGEGAKGNLNSLAAMVSRLPVLPFGFSKNRRSLVYVGNLSHFIARTAEKKVGGILLPQDERPLSIAEIVSIIGRSLRKNPILIPMPEVIVSMCTAIMPKFAKRLFGTLMLDSRETNERVDYFPAFSTEEGFARMFGSRDLQKIRIARVVTAPEAVTFHLRNTLDFADPLWEITVIGTGVSRYKGQWPEVKWIDLPISRKVSLIEDFVSLLRLTSHFIRHRYDIVHSIMPKAGLLVAISSFITMIPIRLHTFTGQTWANRRGLSRRFFAFLDRVTVHLNTKCYTDSFSQSQFLLKNGVGDWGDPLSVIGLGSLSGVNMSRFDASNFSSQKILLKESFGLREDATIFTFIGRKCLDKGTHELLEAFNELSITNDRVQLMLVGPDDDPQFQEEFQKYKTNKHIITFGFTTEPEKFFAVSDVFCLPSHREGFGTVVIEAAAMGVPSIGTRIPGLEDAVIDGETGILVERENPAQLKSAMSKFATHPDLVQEMGLKAKARAIDHFSAQVHIGLLSKEYQRLFGELV